MSEESERLLEQWKKVAYDLATACNEAQMIAAYDAWRELKGDE